MMLRWDVIFCHRGDKASTNAKKAILEMARIASNGFFSILGMLKMKRI